MLNKNLVLIILSVFASGCGMEYHTYVMTKERVGLNQTGNGGCVMGQCPAAPAPAEKTRKIYVLEITKPVPESEVQKIEKNAISAIVGPTEAPPASHIASAASASAAGGENASVVPGVGPSAAATQNGGNLQAQTYTVQKDDTLQKISKKLYGSYGKWYKIYEANKDKIKNPNFVRPGTVLTIPVIK